MPPSPLAPAARFAAIGHNIDTRGYCNVACKACDLSVKHKSENNTRQLGHLMRQAGR